MTDFAASLKDFLSMVQATGPWGVVFFLWWQGQKDRKVDAKDIAEQNRRWEEKHSEVVRMYESNVDLVKDAQKRELHYEVVVKDYKELVMLVTGIVTELKDLIKHNLYCPMVRKETRPKEDAIR